MAKNRESKARHALFHLKDDPDESVNLVGTAGNRAGFRGRADEMKDRLLVWLERAGSLLKVTVEERKFA